MRSGFAKKSARTGRERLQNSCEGFERDVLGGEKDSRRKEGGHHQHNERNLVDKKQKAAGVKLDGRR